MSDQSLTIDGLLAQSSSRINQCTKFIQSIGDSEQVFTQDIFKISLSSKKGEYAVNIFIFYLYNSFHIIGGNFAEQS